MRNRKSLRTRQVLAILKQLEGVSIGTNHLQYYERTGLIRPSVAPGGRGTGHPRLWSLEDVILLRWMVRLRKEGLSLRRFRRALNFLRRQLPEVMGKPEELFFLVDGQEVATVLPQEKVAMRLTGTPGQTIFIWPISRIARETAKECERLAA